jgi:hypothetical protein
MAVALLIGYSSGYSCQPDTSRLELSFGHCIFDIHMPILALRHLPDNIPHLPICHQHNNLGMSELEQDQLPQSMAQETGKSFQHWAEEQLKSLLLL